MGFMARMLTLCSLPRADPGDRMQYKRQNGPYKLIMIAGGDNKLPYGNLPRLLLAWLCTEAFRTQEKKLVLGQSLSAFMQQLGIKGDSGGSRGDRTRLKNQIDRLFNCHIDMIYETREGKASTGGGLPPRQCSGGITSNRINTRSGQVGSRLATNFSKRSSRIPCLLIWVS